WIPKEQEWMTLDELAYRQITKSATDTVSGAVSALKADAREEEQIAAGLSEVEPQAGRPGKTMARHLGSAVIAPSRSQWAFQRMAAVSFSPCSQASTNFH